MKTFFKIIIVVVLGISLSGCKSNSKILSQQRNTPESQQIANTTDEVEVAPNTTSLPTQNQPGEYVLYDEAKVATAARDGQAVLFFHAKWCPTCKIADQDIRDNLASIPRGLVIFQTDYDTYTDLEKKYGVTYQHTFVQVDEEGNEIVKWNGGGLDEIIQRVR